MSRHLTALVVLLVVASGCGPLHPLTASSSPAGSIPWLPLPANPTAATAPSPRPVPVPPGTPACTAGQLRAAVVGQQGAGGNWSVSFAFSGSGQSDCYLDGMPAVTVYDAAGHALPFKVRAPFGPPTGVEGRALVSPGPTPELNTGLKYGEAAFSIDWVSQPEACLGQAAVVPASARIGIKGGSLTIPMQVRVGAYTCQGLGVSSFVSPPAQVEPAPEPPVPAVTVSITGSAVAGKPFSYLVVLTNTTNQTMDLAAQCPSYEEEMFAGSGLPLGGKHFYMLNCNPAGSLAPRARVAFQMVYPVAADAAPGRYNLMFRLLNSDSLSKPAEQPVEVTAAA